MKLVVAILLGLAVVLPARAANYDVYLFAGQSNMDGRGKVADLSAEQRRPFAFIKGSKGGTSLSRDWKPGTGPCYRNLIETVSREPGTHPPDLYPPGRRAGDWRRALDCAGDGPGADGQARRLRHRRRRQEMVPRGRHN